MIIMNNNNNNFSIDFLSSVKLIYFLLLKAVKNYVVKCFVFHCPILSRARCCA